VYLETATLLWNGNEVVGRDAVVKYLTALPASDHKVTTLDSQPVTSMYYKRYLHRTWCRSYNTAIIPSDEFGWVLDKSSYF